MVLSIGVEFWCMNNPRLKLKRKDKKIRIKAEQHQEKFLYIGYITICSATKQNTQRYSR